MADALMREETRDAAEVRLNRLLNLILDSAVETLGFDAATVSVRQEKDLATIATTDQRLVALDDAQYETGEGPCLEVLDPHEPISLDDASEPADRWQHFARTAEHLGIRSSLSMHLPVESDGLAASVNLYSHIHKALGEDEIAAAVPFADQLGTAIQSVDAHRSTAKLAQNMAEAMRSRAVIEQAKGMLMAEKHIDADAAFQMLVRLSQHANVKLRDVAGRVVTQRSTPD